MKLPMLYECSVILPYAEGNAAKKTFILDVDNIHGDISREDYVSDLVARHYPEAIELSIRLMRPKEIKQLVPFEERVQRTLVRGMMTHLMILSQIEDMREVA